MSDCHCSAIHSLLGSGFLAGLGATLNIVGVPALRESKDPLPAWKKTYNNGKNMAVTLIFYTSGMALKAYSRTQDNRFLYVAGTTLLIPIYTVIVMKPTNDALHAISNESYMGNSEEEAKVRKLINKWDKLQMVRTALGIAAFGINVIIVIKKLQQK